MERDVIASHFLQRPVAELEEEMEASFISIGNSCTPPVYSEK